MTPKMLKTILTRLVRDEFNRTLSFEEGQRPDLPECPDDLPRLLYLHVPFCRRLCPYCSFNRIPFEKETCRSYFKALRKEMGLYKARGYDFQGLYAGGGTPTVMPEELVETLHLANELFAVREISVETNPDDLRAAGETLAGVPVQRLSVGVQSFQDGLLKEMDRYEKYGSGQQIAASLRELQGRFPTLNVDMIFNFPTQTEAMLEDDLCRLVDLGVDQITYYPLMVSDYTRREMEAKMGLLDYRKEERFYRRIVERLTPAYRFSSAWCFSKAASGGIIDEYIVQYGEYAGLGSGSIGYLGGACYANTFNIPEYVRLVEAGRPPIQARRLFSRREMARYDLLMNLFGLKLPKSYLFKKYGPRAYFGLARDLGAFMLIGALKYKEGSFCLTGRGAYLWVIMMREFFTAVNNFRDYCRKRM